jgi:hypothetical protein
VRQSAEAAKRKAEDHTKRWELFRERPIPPPPTERQQRIQELRTSFQSRRPAVWEVGTETLPEPARPAEKPSWVPLAAFTVAASCAHCGGPMGALVTWPSYMGVPRTKHPLQCTECKRLSGAPCPCPECS